MRYEKFGRKKEILLKMIIYWLCSRLVQPIPSNLLENVNIWPASGLDGQPAHTAPWGSGYIPLFLPK